jgi:hypothetical protein
VIDQVDVDLRAVLWAVRDQGARPTCLAHAASAAHEHALGLTVWLSPEYLHFFSNGGGANPGRSMDETAKALREKGQPEEAQCPYLAVDPAAGWTPPGGLKVFRRASETKSAGAAEAEEAIRAGRIPILGVSLPEPFFIPKAPWIIGPGGRIRGLHAVAGVGVGRHGGDRVVLIRNSWGPDWADGGYAWLLDAFITRHMREVLLLGDEVAA